MDLNGSKPKLGYMEKWPVKEPLRGFTAFTKTKASRLMPLLRLFSLSPFCAPVLPPAVNFSSDASFIHSWIDRK
jgi:hypothetical protein